MGRSPTFKVAKFKNRWAVNISATVSDTGKRKRLLFATKREAQAYAEELRIGQRNHGAMASKMPLAQRLEAQEALAILAPYGVNLTQAAKFYAQRQTAIAASVPLEEVIDRYLREPKVKDLSDAHIAKFDNAIRKLSAKFGEKVVEEIEPADIIAALDQYSKASTWNGYRRYLNILFAYAKKRGICTANPISTIDPRNEDAQRRAIFTADEAKRLMAAAEAHEEGAYAPYYAVCLFAGLRPVNEAPSLQWDDVDLGRSSIYVTPKTAKGGRDRYAEISPNLVEWLQKYRGAGRRVTPRDYKDNRFRKARDEICTAASVTWDNDIMRHTFCSYWIAKHNDSGRLCEIAGHSVAVSLKHYRRAVPAEEAEKFWKITP